MSALYVGGGVNLASTLNVASGTTFGGGIRVATGTFLTSSLASTICFSSSRMRACSVGSGDGRTVREALDACGDGVNGWS